MRSCPERLFLDVKCTTPFPLRIDPGRARFHLVCVVSGAAQRCRAEHGGSGTLGVSARPIPGRFIVPALHGEDVIHVIDELALPLVLEHLDTVPDFVRYLRAREDFIRSGRFHGTMGEENLLGAYLWEMFAYGSPGFQQFTGPTFLMDDIWDKYCAEPSVQEYRQRIVGSYAWDAAIELLSDGLVTGTGMLGNDPPAIHEKRIRQLARTTRTERIDLANALAGLFAMPREEGLWRYRAARISTCRDTMFAFVLAPYEESGNETKRAERQGQLRAYCMAVKAEHPDVKNVVGVATCYRSASGLHSEDVLHIDDESWTAEHQFMARDTIDSTGLYRHAKLTIRSNRSGGPLLLSPNQRRRLRNERKRQSKHR